MRRWRWRRGEADEKRMGRGGDNNEENEGRGRERRRGTEDRKNDLVILENAGKNTAQMTLIRFTIIRSSMSMCTNNCSKKICFYKCINVLMN